MKVIKVEETIDYSWFVCVKEYTMKKTTVMKVKTIPTSQVWVCRRIYLGKGMENVDMNIFHR